MKSKITYALKTVFLFILFLGLINCEEEAIEDSVSVIAEPEFSIQEKSFIELSSDSNFIANIDHLKSIKEEVKKGFVCKQRKEKRTL